MKRRKIFLKGRSPIPLYLPVYKFGWTINKRIVLCISKVIHRERKTFPWLSQFPLFLTTGFLFSIVYQSVYLCLSFSFYVSITLCSNLYNTYTHNLYNTYNTFVYTHTHTHTFREGKVQFHLIPFQVLTFS